MTRSTHQLVEHFFRHESANLVAVLTRAFGIRRLDLVEDMVQAAMLEAMHAWKQRGIPENPAAWIHRVAKNRILDALRREKTHEKAAVLSGQGMVEQASLVDEWLEESRLSDSLLRMIFVCCHPSLERKTQIALTLKTLCGFGVSEISRGLLLPKETVKKRLQRAKQSLASANVSIDLPRNEELAQRLDVVHDVLYLMFNEGYSTSHGAIPIRDDICEEAARLCHILCKSACANPSTYALMALLLFHGARLDSRTDDGGQVVLLEDQDRSQWDQSLIDVAKFWLAKSRQESPSTFHYEAAISMQHCLAPSVEATDWKTIVQLYDRLLRLRDSPVYRLNQAIALAQAGNLQEAMLRLQELRSNGEMEDYLLLDCAVAQVHELDGNEQEAIDAYLVALGKADAIHERHLIESKLRRLS